MLPWLCSHGTLVQFLFLRAHCSHVSTFSTAVSQHLFCFLCDIPLLATGNFCDRTVLLQFVFSIAAVHKNVLQEYFLKPIKQGNRKFLSVTVDHF